MGSILGSIIRGDTRPKVPPLKTIDAGQEQVKAINNNLNALPEAEQLVSQTNAFTQQQIEQMLERAVPNYQELSSTVSKNTLSLAKGEVPQGVQDTLQLSDAARALSGGFGGTGMFGNLVARDLGLTSLSLMDRGTDTASRWLQTMNSLYSPGMINVASMFLTPQQQIAHDVSERDKQWDVAWLKAQRDAMPNQYQSAFAGLFDSIEQLGRSALGAMAGGGLGGMK